MPIVALTFRRPSPNRRLNFWGLKMGAGIGRVSPSGVLFSNQPSPSPPDNVPAILLQKHQRDVRELGGRLREINPGTPAGWRQLAQAYKDIETQGARLVKDGADSDVVRKITHLRNELTPTARSSVDQVLNRLQSDFAKAAKNGWTPAEKLSWIQRIKDVEYLFTKQGVTRGEKGQWQWHGIDASSWMRRTREILQGLQIGLTTTATNNSPGPVRQTLASAPSPTPTKDGKVVRNAHQTQSMPPSGRRKKALATTIQYLDKKGFLSDRKIDKPTFGRVLDKWATEQTQIEMQRIGIKNTASVDADRVYAEKVLGARYADRVVQELLKQAVLEAPQEESPYFCSFNVAGVSVLINGGTLKDKEQVFASVRKIFNTEPRGAEMKSELLKDKRPLLIDIKYTTSSGITVSGIIDFNPRSYVSVETQKGYQRLPADVALAHEMGHVVFGDSDNGPEFMDNVIKNENPFRAAWGYPLRTSYITTDELGGFVDFYMNKLSRDIVPKERERTMDNYLADTYKPPPCP